MSEKKEAIEEPCAECLDPIKPAPIYVMLLRLRNAIGIKKLSKEIDCDRRVINNYINTGTEPRWERGVVIYNLAVKELCTL